MPVSQLLRGRLRRGLLRIGIIFRAHDSFFLLGALLIKASITRAKRLFLPQTSWG